jgi:hypothetical protein
LGVDIIEINKELEKEILLTMNKHMMEKGIITYEFYMKAKAKIEKLS